MSDGISIRLVKQYDLEDDKSPSLTSLHDKAMMLAMHRLDIPGYEDVPFAERLRLAYQFLREKT